MWKVISAMIMLVLVIGSTNVDARGGRSSDDCPIGTKDPDCQ